MTGKIKRRGKFFVYIVECADGTYYTGFTPDIERRVKIHNGGKGRNIPGIGDSLSLSGAGNISISRRRFWKRKG
jgi:hypothetical protein